MVTRDVNTELSRGRGYCLHAPCFKSPTTLYCTMRKRPYVVIGGTQSGQNFFSSSTIGAIQHLYDIIHLSARRLAKDVFVKMRPYFLKLFVKLLGFFLVRIFCADVTVPCIE